MSSIFLFFFDLEEKVTVRSGPALYPEFMKGIGSEQLVREDHPLNYPKNDGGGPKAG